MSCRTMGFPIKTIERDFEDCWSLCQKIFSTLETVSSYSLTVFYILLHVRNKWIFPNRRCANFRRRAYV